MMEFIEESRDIVMILCGIALGVCSAWYSYLTLFGENKEKIRWKKYSKMMWKKRHESDLKGARKCR